MCGVLRAPTLPTFCNLRRARWGGQQQEEGPAGRFRALAEQSDACSKQNVCVDYDFQRSLIALCHFVWLVVPRYSSRRAGSGALRCR